MEEHSHPKKLPSDLSDLSPIDLLEYLKIMEGNLLNFQRNMKEQSNKKQDDKEISSPRQLLRELMTDTRRLSEETRKREKGLRNWTTNKGRKNREEMLALRLKADEISDSILEEWRIRYDL